MDNTLEGMLILSGAPNDDALEPGVDLLRRRIGVDVVAAHRWIRFCVLLLCFRCHEYFPTLTVVVLDMWPYGISMDTFFLLGNTT